MAVLPILITGDPVLHTPAAIVTEFGPFLATLVDDLYETMAAAPGVGLAAPQVGVDLAVFVFDWTDDSDRTVRGVAINPELFIAPVPLGEADEEDESEGCLSVPGERYPLRRSPRAILRAVDLSGDPFEIVADGWLARIFQHEYDHLAGILYLDRLHHGWDKSVAKMIKKQSWGVPGNTWLPGRDDLDA